MHTRARTASIVAGLLGGIVFAFTLGNITSLISTTSGANLRFEQKLVALKEYDPFPPIQRPAPGTLQRKPSTYSTPCSLLPARREEDQNIYVCVLPALPGQGWIRWSGWSIPSVTPLLLPYPTPVSQVP